MAPYVPEEVDVFSVPHSRMKALVDEYSQMLRTTNFSNDVDHQLLLESLYRTFVEFKTHEQIENRFIMRRLKAKLKRLSIQDSAVCNCHKDNVLLDMLGFIKDGFQKKTEQDRINYGRRLKELLESFTHSFLPHMKEEEEVFQPLLLQHFSYEELCELKQNVINQHIMRKRSPEHGSDKLEKWVSEDSREDSASDVEEEVKPDASFCNLPPEISLKIFGYLGPQDLCRAAQVSREWNSFCLEPCLWSRILPVQWAHGLWTFDEKTSVNTEDAGSHLKEVMDEDADEDESSDDPRIIKSRHEAKILHGVCHHLVPRVGSGVEIIKLSRSKSLSTSLTQKLLKSCPNVRHLDLSYTKVSDLAFKSASRGDGLSQLQHLDLSGCKFITDTVLLHLAMALARTCAQPRPLQHIQQDDTCLCQDFYALCEQVLNVRLSEMDRNRNEQVCNTCCGQDEGYAQWDTVEDCLPKSNNAQRKNVRNRWSIKYLSLSGCFQITDIGIRALALSGFFPFLSHLDLSGCFRLTADGLNTFVDRCPALLASDLYYCDNLTGGPFEDQASGCQNLECSSRACCRSGE